ncbi:hypothetical protein MOPEL_029_00150 [Mobilicoccus pelagius NBRC 104925]|uniref:Uncharacterized protein n=1 Tax=Mobilicoccus pelagius NBRC 104925 TaxID=1089455 RepID=H5UPT1_9MICO|nr:hypothetical protein MOPEL_029_00150 [Mobilicoccus pelagius NBRC 104925]
MVVPAVDEKDGSRRDPVDDVDGTDLREPVAVSHPVDEVGHRHQLPRGQAELADTCPDDVAHRRERRVEDECGDAGVLDRGEQRGRRPHRERDDGDAHVRTPLRHPVDRGTQVELFVQRERLRAVAGITVAAEVEHEDGVPGSVEAGADSEHVRLVSAVAVAADDDGVCVGVVEEPTDERHAVLRLEPGGLLLEPHFERGERVREVGASRRIEDPCRGRADPGRTQPEAGRHQPCRSRDPASSCRVHPHSSPVVQESALTHLRQVGQ